MQVLFIIKLIKKIKYTGTDFEIHILQMNKKVKYKYCYKGLTLSQTSLCFYVSAVIFFLFQRFLPF